jgi:hypothetical protein
VVKGAAQSLSWYSAVRSGPSRTPSRAFAASAPFHSLIQPASANSAVQITSMPTMSMSESSAASRRATSSRCWSASVGRRTYSTL